MTLKLVIDWTLEILSVSLPERLLVVFELATTVTPFDGNVVVVGAIVVDGAVVVEVVRDVVVESGMALFPAPSHVPGAP